jgi:arginase family enzyme
LWSRPAALNEVRRRLARTSVEGASISLLGSGDFHHLAALLHERIAEPFTLIHLDNHPDWVRLAPRWHCGSWVNRTLELPNLKRIFTLGPCSEDLVRPDLKGGNLPALASGRLVLMPWKHAPSKVWRRLPDGLGHQYKEGALHWSNLAESGIGPALDAIIRAIPTPAIWFSIDKDVLSESDAVTNWDQGEMPLAAAVEVIRTLGAHKRVLGADICGEYSPPQHRNWFKRWEARMDQPQRVSVEPTLLARNEATNRTLLQALASAAGVPTAVMPSRPC